MERQTTFAKTGEVDQQWHLIDADGQVLGRMATQIATLLMGKHKPTYTSHVDSGDFVIVVNASSVHMTGRKAEQKFYKSYSGYPGGLKQVSYAKLRQTKPEKLIELAVQRMLPKSALGKAMLNKLKVYAGAEHPHVAQHPKPFEPQTIA